MARRRRKGTKRGVERNRARSATLAKIASALKSGRRALGAHLETMSFKGDGLGDLIRFQRPAEAAAKSCVP
jgi:hypothetical protein